MITIPTIKLEPNEIHIWSAQLAMTTEQKKERWVLLSEDERERAKRFRFQIHREHYIAARGILRQILSIYLNNIPPRDIVFQYAKHHKPAVLIPHHTNLQFNLAHSHDIAIYAVTLQHAVGIDIEKIQETYEPSVAERFFSPEENAALMQLPMQNRASGFYRLWSRKEAIIKAIGIGLAMPLSVFSVSVNAVCETIVLENIIWHLQSLSICDGYQAALASNQKIAKIIYWSYSERFCDLAAD